MSRSSPAETGQSRHVGGSRCGPGTFGGSRRESAARVCAGKRASRYTLACECNVRGRPLSGPIRDIRGSIQYRLARTPPGPAVPGCSAALPWRGGRWDAARAGRPGPRVRRPPAGPRHTGPARDVGRLPAPLPADLRRPARAPASGARAASTLGAVVHLALRSFYDLPAGAARPDAAAALVDRHWSGEGFRDAAQAARYRLRAREWVADYAAGAGADAHPSRWSAGCRRRRRGSSPRAAPTGSTPGTASWCRRLQDGPAAGPRRRPPVAGAGALRRRRPAHACAGPARASSCTTCPPARSSPPSTTRRRSRSTWRGRRTPRRTRPRRRAGRGRCPGRAVPGPAGAALRVVRRPPALRRGPAAAPELEPWASLAP